jgi:hypothetical protein
MRKKNNRKAIVLLLLAVLLAALIYGFAASNTVPTSYAGDGLGTVSGYQVSNIVWTLNSSNPTLMDKVTFTLDASASTVQVTVDGGSNWLSCSNTSGNDWECDWTSEPTVESITELRVVAVQ